MPLTKALSETIADRINTDPDFRRELLFHGVELMLAGDVATGKHLLRDYIEATIGFTQLAADLSLTARGLQRMLGASGNPQTNNFFRIVAHLQALEGVHLEVRAA